MQELRAAITTMMQEPRAAIMAVMMVLAMALKKQLGDEKYIGVYLPPCAPAAIVNFAITLLGKRF